MKYVVLFYILFILLFSCKNQQTPKTVIDNKDSLLNVYISTLDSYSYIGNHHNMLILKAIQSMDTTKINNVVDEYKRVYNLYRYYDEIYKCVGFKTLHDSKYEEVYRFEYRRSFCDIMTFITVGRIHDTFEMESITLKYDSYKNICDIKSSNKINLTQKQWDNFNDELNAADFWGLSYSNNNSGFDGASLNIIGVIKPKLSYEGEYNLVNRWQPLQYPIGKLFMKLYNQSNTKVDCYFFEYLD